MINPVNRIDLIKKAESQLKTKNYDEALGNITQCLDFFPAFSPAKVLLAEVYFRKGKHEFALKELSNIISDSPDNLRARKLIVEVLLEAGNKEEAKSHLNFLEFILPNDDSEFLRLKDLVEKSEKQNNKDNKVVLAYDTNEHMLEDDVTDVTDVFDQADFIEKLEIKEEEDLIDVKNNEIVTVTLDKRHEEDSGIKTMTLASIYEKQGMMKEALNILERLYSEGNDPKVRNEIKRLKSTMEGNHPESLKKLKIEKLNNWLVSINAIR